VNDVLVANYGAHLQYPDEHGHKAVGNRAKHENVQGPHAVFEQRETDFRHNIRHGQERPGRQPRNEKLSGPVAEAEYRNP
jgi:hypothetical protein